MQTQVAIVGGGPAGLTAAIALASAGVATVLVAPPAPADVRTTALLANSVTALETLGVWARCHGDAAPLRQLRLVDDTGRLLRAPEVLFSADEIRLDAFGYNIANRNLVAALDAQARTLPNLLRQETTATAIDIGVNDVRITLTSGESISAHLVVGADGRRSLCRKAAGIRTTSRAGTQSALALSFAHRRPHSDISTEFHTAEGPFTTVPLPGRRSSLVWVLGPGSAKRIAAWDDDTLSAEVERRSHSILGACKVDADRGVFPLSAERAQRFAARRVALIGEAAHVLPPIGAQGLNVGLRDAAQIAELVIDAQQAGDDIGGETLLSHYDSLRRADVASRSFAVDMLNRSLLTGFLPVQGLRGLGLYALDRIGPLRRLVMREGVAPSAATPALMRDATSAR